MIEINLLNFETAVLFDMTSEGLGTGDGHVECGDEPSGSIKCGEFLD